MTVKYRNVKFRLETPEKSFLLQEELMKHGCDWITKGRCPRYTEAKYIYVDSYGVITYGHCDTYFSSISTHEEIEPHFSWAWTATVSLPAPRVKEREKVILSGKIYFKDELDKALEKLEVCK